ncbi:YgaP family membrane protein [sulfur-oxidizing endosymbiont of Gigantopelta aegis]|uniref:YgaP family membrane protein n=1 Tax=sulfur-oxidizing endosymbiont of Gigantopelta aegis TaxID=2794934 RepID=UPI0018DC99EB|nr:DUF2892 domain-containing protein [sulfur-oxidizing endosymbiont of Gigantopelta aegis]
MRDVYYALNGITMTERTFRIFLGAGLFLLLYVTASNDYTHLLPYYIALLIFEGVTNWRVPKILTWLDKRSKQNTLEMKTVSGSEKSVLEQKKLGNIPFEAERAMRLVIALILITPLFFSMEELWIIPWFVASMLLLAGVTNICPMVMFFRWLGFR